MYGTDLPAWLDNPILVKHVRSRLRPQAFFASLAVVVLLCICIALAGYQLDMFTERRRGRVAAGASRSCILVIMGSGQVERVGQRGPGLGHPRLPPRLADDARRAHLRLLLRRADPRICAVRRDAALHWPLHGLRRPELPRLPSSS